MRSTLRSVIWVGMISTALSGCGPAPMPGESLIQQRPAIDPALPNVPTSPLLNEIGHLLTIQSDAVGRSSPKRVFDLEIMTGKDNELLFLNFHLRGLRRTELPVGGGFGNAEIREKICEENSQKLKENCTADLEQLKSSGIVMQRLAGRPKMMTLTAEHNFSASKGGVLVIRYIQKAADLTNPALDVMAEFRLRLEPTQYGWIVLSPLHADLGVVGALKINSSFTNVFADGVESIEVGTDQNSLR